VNFAEKENESFLFCGCKYSTLFFWQVFECEKISFFISTNFLYFVFLCLIPYIAQNQITNG
jgi:hypothetical protein